LGALCLMIVSSEAWLHVIVFRSEWNLYHGWWKFGLVAPWMSGRRMFSRKRATDFVQSSESAASNDS
jgi:hypothetical protein